MNGLLNIPTRHPFVSLRVKTSLLIGVWLLVFLAAIFVLAQGYLLGHFSELESESAHVNLNRVTAALDSEVNILDMTTSSWAHLDSTYAYAKSRDPQYIEQTFSRTTYDLLQLNMVVILDHSGDLLYGHIHNGPQGAEFTFSIEMMQTFLDNTPAVEGLSAYLTGTEPISGLIVTPFGPMLVASQPIVGSDEQQASRGNLVVGRLLNDSMIKNLSNAMSLSLDIKYVGDPGLSPDFQAAIDDLASGSPSVIRPLSDRSLGAYTLLPDLVGQPALVLRITVPRDTYRQGSDTIRSFVLLCLAAGLLAAIGMLGLMEQQVIHRLLALERGIRRISESGDLTRRVPCRKNDELTSMALSLNAMLDAIQRSDAVLRQAQGELEQRIQARTHELAAERNLLRTLIDTLPHYIYVKDTQSRFVIANRVTWRNMPGATRAEDLIGKTDLDFYDSELAQSYFDDERAIFRTGEPLLEKEERGHTAGQWILTTKVPLRDESGAITGLIGIGQDITERKQATETLRRSRDDLEQRVQERTAELSAANARLTQEIAERIQVEEALAAERNLLRTLIDTLPDTIYAKDREGRKLLANLADAQVLGVEDPADLIGKTDAEFYNRESASGFEADDRAVLESGEPMLYREEFVHAHGGEARWLLTTKVPLRDPQGQVIGMVGIGRDITERKRTEFALRESEQRLELAVKATGLGLWDWDITTDRVVYNDRWAEIMGYELAEVGSTADFWRSHIHPDDLPLALGVLAVPPDWGAMLPVREYRLRSKTGDWKWVLDQGRVVERSRDGQPLRMIGAYVDITARKQADAERERLLDQSRSRAAELAAVAEVTRQATTILDVEPLLWAVSDLIQQKFDLYHVHIYLFEETNQALHLRSGSGEIGRLLVRHQPIPLAFEGSLVAQAARTRQIVVENDTLSQPAFLPSPLLPETRSEIALPLIVRDRLIGVLNIEDDVRGRFGPDEVSIFSILAAQGAIAIHNAQQFADAARRLAIIENSDTLIALADMRTSRLMPLYVNPSGVKMLGYDRPEDLLKRPVRCFYPPEERRRLRKEILPTAQTQGIWRGENSMLRQDGTRVLVEQTVLAIPGEDGKPRDLATIVTDITERKQVEEALRRANRAYQTLSDCNQAMMRAADEDSLLVDICQIAVATGGYRLAWIGYTVPGEVLPVARAWAGHEDGFLKIALGDLVQGHPGPTLIAIRDGEPVVVRDIAGDSLYAPWRDEALARGYQSMITVPLVIDGTVIGNLNVYAGVPHAFDTEEINLLRKLAGDVAYGIQTLRTRLEREQAEEQLRSSQARLLALIENTRDSIWSVNANHEMLIFNSALKAVFQEAYGVDLQPGMRASDYLSGDEQAERTSDYNRALAGEQFQVERHYDLVPGGPVDLEISFNPIIGSDGQVSGVTVFSRDITRRKQTEAQLIQLNKRLAQRNRELLTLYEAGRQISATLDVREIYRLLYADVVHRLLDAPTCLVALFDEQAQTLTCDYAVVDDEEHDPATLPVLPLGDGPNSEAVRTRQPRIFDPYAAYGEGYTGSRIQIGDDRVPRSGMVVPLISRNRVLGVLNIQRHDLAAFEESDLTLLSTLANQAATAIENARLFTAERAQRLLAQALRETATALTRALNSQEVIDLILGHLEQVLPHSAANVMWLENNRARVVGGRGYAERGLDTWIKSVDEPLERLTLIQKMLADGQPQVVSDIDRDMPGWALSPQVAWVKSYAGAPIQYEGRVFGILNVYGDQPGFFAAADAVRLRAFADQAAIAIQNAQLFTATQQHAATLQEQAQRLSLINRISGKLAQTLDLHEVYEIALTEMQNVLGAQFAGLVLVETPESGRLVLDTHPEAHRWPDELLPMKNNPSMDLLRQTRQPILAPDVLHDPLFEPVWDLLRDRGTRSLMLVPLLSGTELIGSLGLDWTGTRQFSLGERQIAQTIANQVAVAVTKAQLYQSEHDQRMLAEALRDTAEAINSALNFDDVLDLILENMARVLPHDAANIMLIQDGVARVVRGQGYAPFGVEEWVRSLRRPVNQMPLWTSMLASGEPFAMPDTAAEPQWSYYPEEAWIRSTVKAPIMVEGRSIGILHIDSATPGTFNRHHADRLKAFADQAAVALRNVQLFAAERDQRVLAEALRDTAAVINSSLDFEIVADRILANVGQVAPYDAASLLLIEQGSARVIRRVNRRYEFGDLHRFAHIRMDVNAFGNLKTMIETGQPTLIQDTWSDPDWVVVPEASWVRSHTGAPIRREGQVVGFILLDVETPGFFTPIHAERLQTFADQAAIALANAELFRSVQRHASELEERVRQRTLELEQRRVQLQTILDSISEGLVYDENLAIRFTNRALTSLTGFAAEEYTHYVDLLRSGTLEPEAKSDLAQRIFDSVDRLGIWRGEMRLGRKDGSEFDAAIVVTPVYHLEGEVVGAVTVIRDISQEKALREQQVRFIASASHELRTPLANIKTRLYLLQRQPERAGLHLEVLERVADSMGEMIENLLDVSRFERGVIPLRRRPVLLQDIVNEVLNVQRAEADRKEITLSVALAAQPLHVNADPQRLAQVVTNLVSNAINYTLPGGAVRVELDEADEDHARWAVLRVSDTGIGIAPHLLNQVFEPFFRANDQAATGTGLGLTIAREIVKLHEGRIEADSRPGEGSTFTVRLALVGV